MLEYIRNSAQSFGVKIAFGIIILVFVFWGIGNFNERDYSNVVAVVNGEPIVAFEFEKAYQNAEEYLLRQNPGLTREDLAKDHLGRQVLRELIQATLLNQEAKKHAIAVSPIELRRAVGQIKVFQNDKGQFDPEIYKRVLAARRMSPAQYEQELSNQILHDKIFTLVTAGAWVDSEEARHRFDFLKERRTVDWLFIGANSESDKIAITDEQMTKWYEDHKSSFMVPQMVNIEYIKVIPSNLVKRAELSEEAAKKWYESNKTQFTSPEQIHARHILVPVSEEASAEERTSAESLVKKIKQEIQNGLSFSAAADKYNQPGAAAEGGDLGWLMKGQTVPEFEEAAFALPVGEVSGPVRTQFGLHLILVDEKKSAGVKSFEEVADHAFQAIATEEGLEKLPEVLDNLIEDNILQKSLSESAAKYGLKDEKTGLSDKAMLIQKLGIKDTAAEALLAATGGIPLDTALEANDGYVIARILETSPESIKPFSEVKDQIAVDLRKSLALERSMQEAQSIFGRIKDEKLTEVKAQYPTLKQDHALERVGMIPGFRADDRLIEQIFEIAPGNWLNPQIVTTDTGKGGSILVYVAKAESPDTSDFASVAEILGNAARQERIEGLYNMFLQSLAQNAKVEITNTNIIDRVN